jgi:hypothetical protein
LSSGLPSPAFRSSRSWTPGRATPLLEFLHHLMKTLAIDAPPISGLRPLTRDPRPLTSLPADPAWPILLGAGRQPC